MLVSKTAHDIMQHFAGTAPSTPPPLSQRNLMPTPLSVVRQQVRRPDGAIIDQLHVIDVSTGSPITRRVFQFVRTIRAALMGKVKAAVECSLDPTGNWSVPSDPRLHRMFAVKQLYKYCVANRITTDHRPVREDPMNEIAVMAWLASPGHENILRLETLLADENCIYLVLEHCDGGELFDQVSALGHVREDVARHYIWQLATGLRYMHAKGVAHRDVSLENAMLQTHAWHALQARAGAYGPDAQQQQSPIAQDGPVPLHQAMLNQAAVSFTGGVKDAKANTLAAATATLASTTPLMGGAAAAAAAAIAACGESAGSPGGNRDGSLPMPPTVKIIDFGLSVRLPPSREWLLLPENRVGKDRYMPPEIHGMLPYDGARADVWTLGM